MSQAHGADSEVGRLRTVLVHRPGPELRRITPRTAGRLLFGVLPWVGRAQQEHDALASVLREHGIEVLYVTELLQDTLEYQPARSAAITTALAGAALGDELGALVRGRLDGLDPEALARVLIAGLTTDELTAGRGVVFEMLDRHDFVIDPLPNLAFSRDSSVWIGDRVAVTSLAMARRRESELMGVIYGYHPRFAGTKCLYGPELEQVTGGDVLLLAPSVIAVGVGERTGPAAVERLARRVFDAGLAHTVLAVRLERLGPAAHLDTVCTMVDVDTVIMYPRLAFTLTAHTITPRPDGLRASRPQPFLEAAAQAMGIDRLKVIGTGVDPLTAPRQQWDDGSNALAIDRRVVVCHERNVETNARLEAAGVQVIRVPASELGSTRGGPRCMTCPVAREPAASPDAGMTSDARAGAAGTAGGEAATEPHRWPWRPAEQLTQAG
ncbi:MAG TPA: arginine deiminase [Streptosporangiaceae bacterium]|nr:arginine deiminase [Streptosporangiaceae bacterium]